MSKSLKYDFLSGKPVTVFLHYFIANAIGLVLVSSAGIVDGIFLGHYAGREPLAAVNLALPFFSVFSGMAVMMSVGGMVRCGKYMGEKRFDLANEVFSKTVYTVIACGLIISFLGMVFRKQIALALGANAVLLPMTSEYLYYLFCFGVFLPASMCMMFFVRTDGKPFWATFAFLVGFLLNVCLDWLLISKLNFGVKGAAIATGCSNVTSFILMASHFMRGKSRLKFVAKVKGFKDMLHNAYNGSSELLTEMSGGIIVFIMNRVMIANFGVQGVASFTVINYLLFFELLICYAITDALAPIISTNFGAQYPERIIKFLKVSVATVMVPSCIMITLFLGIPDKLAGMFLQAKETETIAMAVSFMHNFWPVFLFNGVTVIITAYFTAMHKPLISLMGSLSRALALPLLFLYILPPLFGTRGIYWSIPLAEAVTFVIAGTLYLRNKPHKLVHREYNGKQA